MNRVAPIRDCAGGCGRTKRVWRPFWTCHRCLEADRAAAPESMRDWRQRVKGSGS